MTLSLVAGSRRRWASSTADPRALESPDQSSRTAASWLDPSQIVLQLSFSSAYSGNLYLYAVDWNNLGRSEMVAVDGLQVAALSHFQGGGWVVTPIDVAAGGMVTITVAKSGGGALRNAVLAGLFLGDASTPPAPPPAPSPPAPSPAAPSPPAGVQGNWVGTYGAQGYSLADWSAGNDLTVLPAGVTMNVAQGKRYVWDSAPSDVRALESPDQSGRRAATWYDSAQIQIQLDFADAYSGNLHLYAVDWLSGHRSETIAVNGQQIASLSDFSAGTWVTTPIDVAAGGAVTITVTNTSSVNAVLSAIAFGDGGAPPSPPAASPGVQGNQASVSAPARGGELDGARGWAQHFDTERVDDHLVRATADSRLPGLHRDREGVVCGLPFRCGHRDGSGVREHARCPRRRGERDGRLLTHGEVAHVAVHAVGQRVQRA